MPATDKPSITAKKRRALAEELLTLRRTHDAVFARTEELKSELKAGAEENFKEVFVGKGEISVSAAKDKRFKGTMPEVDADAFLKLSVKKREQLIEAGIVKMTDMYSSPYYGAVSVKIF